MSISTIYRVTHFRPDALQNYLEHTPGEMFAFRLAIMTVQGHYTPAGFTYNEGWEEWAEFDIESHAFVCDRAMRQLIKEWHDKAIKAGY